MCVYVLNWLSFLHRASGVPIIYLSFRVRESFDFGLGASYTGETTLIAEYHVLCGCCSLSSLVTSSST